MADSVAERTVLIGWSGWLTCANCSSLGLDQAVGDGQPWPTSATCSSCGGPWPAPRAAAKGPDLPEWWTPQFGPERVYWRHYWAGYWDAVFGHGISARGGKRTRDGISAELAALTGVAVPRSGAYQDGSDDAWGSPWFNAPAIAALRRLRLDRFYTRLWDTKGWGAPPRILARPGDTELIRSLGYGFPEETNCG